MDVSAEGEGQLEDEFIGRKAIAITDILPERDGKVEYNGSHWEAASQQKIKAKDNVRIVGMKSIKLIVEPIN